ncbi:Bug family tripartite tricarboxylate transporter substrate binding protein [Belnapia rosea]|uniref:Bug family tripartite tricarboxylate transporter substrate binding protein n=1 Tax=Belnapia rosea TaxID=938405 RepID=UPI00088888E2|nr:tripartite tricarboxylate transporter substrate-binding protein [Belnapia rosea]SDB68006.1 Tripartite-type tricarboxylate transporter, receptor component TctC [Belnapia rosea]
MLPRRAWLAGGAVFAALPSIACAQASAWPTQPIRLVVPFAPGGTTDLAARLVSQGLGMRLGQPVIVENRPGAGATLASAQVAQAAPDGLTLLVSNIASHGVAPSLYRNLRYDPVWDFTHIALLLETPSVFVAQPRFPARGIADVVRLSRDMPRGIDIASSGTGSSNHLLIVQFGQVTGARVNHVPYRGAGPAMTDVIADVVPMMSDSLPSSAGHLRAGAVRGMAIASTARHPAFPELPSFREQGVDLVASSWFGLSAPAGLPPAITGRLSREVAAVLADAALQHRFAELGGTVGALSPPAYAEFIAGEVARWAPVVQASGAQVE